MELNRYKNTIELSDGDYDNVIIEDGKISFYIKDKCIHGPFKVMLNNGKIIGGEYDMNQLVSFYKKNKKSEVKYFTIIGNNQFTEL